MAQTTDQLRRFADSGDEQAFRLVVDEHAGLVYSCALRKIGDPESARDVAQTVFAILARKAKKLASHPNLGGWLHRTTILEAAKMIRTEARRFQKHARYGKYLADQHDVKTESDDTPRAQALRMIDDAINRLSPSDRDVIVFRYFQKKTYQDIAALLGKSEAACRRQTARAVTKVGLLLKREGVVLSAAMLTSILSPNLAKAAPPVLCETLSKSALATAPQLTHSAILINTFQTMASTKLKTAGIALSVAALVPVGMNWNTIAHLKTKIAGLEASAPLAAEASAQDLITQIPGSRRRTEHPSEIDEVHASSLMESAVLSYLSGDSKRFDSLLDPLDELSATALATLLDEMETLSGEGPPIDYVRHAIFDRLIPLAPDTAAEYASKYEMYHLVGRALHQWSSQDARRALAWLRERSQSEDFVSKRLWETPRDPYMVHRSGGRMDWQYADVSSKGSSLESLEAFLFKEVFRGMVESDRATLESLLSPLEGEALLGAVKGIGDTHWDLGDDEAYLPFLSQLPDDATRAKALTDYGLQLKKAPSTYAARFESVEALVKQAGLPADLAEETLSIIVSGTPTLPEHYVRAGEWLLGASSDQALRVLSEWVLEDYVATANWMKQIGQSETLDAAALEFIRIAGEAAEPIRQELVEHIAEAIHAPDVRQEALDLAQSGRFPDPKPSRVSADGAFSTKPQPILTQ